MCTSVLIVGAGAIGGTLAARLADSEDLDVTLGARSQFVELTFSADGVETRPRVRVVADPDCLPQQDWVIVATKAYDSVGLSSWLTSPAASDASIAVAQNGVEHAQRVAPFVPSARVLPLIVTLGAERPTPGRIVETLAGKVRLPDTDLGREFATLAVKGTLATEVVTDFTTALWTKLCWNLVGNSLSTITDLPVREIGMRQELRELAVELVRECQAVAREEGALVDPAIAEEMLDMFRAYPDTIRSSMWQDRASGRPLEYDAICGAVVRAAERHDLPSPYSLMATKLLETLSASSTD